MTAKEDHAGACCCPKLCGVASLCAPQAMPTHNNRRPFYLIIKRIDLRGSESENCERESCDGAAHCCEFSGKFNAHQLEGVTEATYKRYSLKLLCEQSWAADAVHAAHVTWCKPLNDAGRDLAAQRSPVSAGQARRPIKIECPDNMQQRMYVVYFVLRIAPSPALQRVGWALVAQRPFASPYVPRNPAQM